MVEFAGTYAHDRDENFEATLSKMGVGFLVRKVIAKGKPTIKVSIDGDTWTMSTVSSVKTITWSFKLDEETEIDMPEGKKKVKFTLEGNTLTQKPAGEADKDKAMMIVREFTDEGMKQVMTHIQSGTAATRYFKRS